MKQFDLSVTETLRYEGLYSQDPNDLGGETYKGISRKFWPNWSGWGIIDEMKRKPGFPKNLELKDKNAIIPYPQNLVKMVTSFYYENFWKKIGGEELLNKTILNILFDTAVNMGITPSIKLAQQTLGIKQTGILDDKLVELLNTIK